MKKHFLEAVDIEKRLVGLYGEHEATLGATRAYDGGAVFGGASLLERSEGCARLYVMQENGARLWSGHGCRGTENDFPHSCDPRMGVRLIRTWRHSDIKPSKQITPLPSIPSPRALLPPLRSAHHWYVHQPIRNPRRTEGCHRRSKYV